MPPLTRPELNTVCETVQFVIKAIASGIPACDPILESYPGEAAVLTSALEKLSALLATTPAHPHLTP